MPETATLNPQVEATGRNPDNRNNGIISRIRGFFKPNRPKLSGYGEGGSRWDYTQLIENNLPSNFFEEKVSPSGESQQVGIVQGRHIIGRDRPINKGVYFTSGHAEALVVDDQKYPRLNQEYQRLLQDTQQDSQTKGLRINQVALGAVFGRVKELLPYSLEGVDRVNRSLGIPETGTPHKISLDVYIAKKTGVCRHQALLTAYFLEHLVSDGFLRGKVSVERNYIPGEGGHAWVRYTNSVGNIYIIDPAMNLISELKDIGPSSNWFYKRPGEG